MRIIQTIRCHWSLEIFQELECDCKKRGQWVMCPLASSHHHHIWEGQERLSNFAKGGLKTEECTSLDGEEDRWKGLGILLPDSNVIIILISNNMQQSVLAFGWFYSTTIIYHFKRGTYDENSTSDLVPVPVWNSAGALWRGRAAGLGYSRYPFSTWLQQKI